MVTFSFSFSTLVVRSALPHCVQALIKTVMLTICTAVAFDDHSQIWVFCGRLKRRADVFALPYQIFSGLHQLFLNNSPYQIIKCYLDFALPSNDSINVVLLHSWLNTEKRIRCSGAEAPVLLSRHQQCCVSNTLRAKPHVTCFDPKKALLWKAKYNSNTEGVSRAFKKASPKPRSRISRKK